MAEVDDDSVVAAVDGVGRLSSFEEPSADSRDGAGRITTSPIDFNSTFSEHAGRQLRQHFDPFAPPPQPQHQHRHERRPHTHQGVVRSGADHHGGGVRTPERPPVNSGNSSSDEKRVRQLQTRIEQQDREISERQRQYERDMQTLRARMRSKQDLIDRLTREEQLSSAALEEQEDQIAKLEEDIDMCVRACVRACVCWMYVSMHVYACALCLHMKWSDFAWVRCCSALLCCPLTAMSAS